MSCPGAVAPGLSLPRALQTLWYLSDPVSFLERGRRAGEAFRVETLIFGEQTFFSRPETLQEAFGLDPDLLRAGEANLVLKKVVGEQSISSLDGAAHQARRRLLLPVIQGATAGHEAATRARTARLLAAAARGEAVPLRSLMRRLTLDAMLEIVFGGAEVGELGASFARLVDRGAIPFAQLGAIPALQRDLGPLSPWGFFARELRQVDAQLYAQIARPRAELGAGLDHRSGGLLGALLQARDSEGRGLPDSTLRDEVFTLLGAGYETTATALAWALELLLLHPGEKARVERELAAGGGVAGASPVLDAVIKESLRLRPVLPTVTRVASRGLRLGGQDLPAGSSLVLCLYLAQREGRAHPEQFYPDRFLGKASGPGEGWFPFGGGPRRCPGMGLALGQMRAVIAAALSHFDLRLARPGPSRPIFRGQTLAPLGGTRAFIERRVGGPGVP